MRQPASSGCVTAGLIESSAEIDALAATAPARQRPECLVPASQGWGTPQLGSPRPRLLIAITRRHRRRRHRRSHPSERNRPGPWPPPGGAGPPKPWGAPLEGAWPTDGGPPPRRRMGCCRPRRDSLRALEVRRRRRSREHQPGRGPARRPRCPGLWPGFEAWASIPGEPAASRFNQASAKTDRRGWLKRWREAGASQVFGLVMRNPEERPQSRANRTSAEKSLPIGQTDVFLLAPPFRPHVHGPTRTLATTRKGLESAGDRAGATAAYHRLGAVRAPRPLGVLVEGSDIALGTSSRSTKLLQLRPCAIWSWPSKPLICASCSWCAKLWARRHWCRPCRSWPSPWELPCWPTRNPLAHRLPTAAGLAVYDLLARPAGASAPAACSFAARVSRQNAASCVLARRRRPNAEPASTTARAQPADRPAAPPLAGRRCNTPASARGDGSARRPGPAELGP